MRKLLLLLTALASVSAFGNPANVLEADFSFIKYDRNVVFTGQSQNNIVQWFWVFGDGSYSFDQVAYHTYEKGYDFMVTLIVRNNLGETAEITKHVYDSPSITVKFDYDIFSYLIDDGTTVSFSGSSSGTIKHWYWDFGDGSWSTSRAPRHNYAASGEYQVSLHVTDEHNEGTSVTHLIRPHCFNYEVNDLTVSFTDVTPNLGFGYSYWNFDGLWTDEKNPVHTFSRPDLYEIYYSKRTTDYDKNLEHQFEITRYLDLRVPEPIGLNETVDLALKKDEWALFKMDLPFNYKRNSVQWFMEEISGNATAYIREGVPPTSYDYDQALYNTGNTDVYTRDEVVYVAVQGGINGAHVTLRTCYGQSPANFDVETLALTAQFSNLTPRNCQELQRFHWSFGDGTESREINPTHTFSQSGTYAVKLTMLASSGFTSSYTMNVTVDQPEAVLLRSTYVPMVPADQKVTCQNNVIDGITYCPVLEWRGYTYWAFSFRDNRGAMNIVAFDPEGNIAGEWYRTGARYINNIVVDSANQMVDFYGQTNGTISLSFEELYLPEYTTVPSQMSPPVVSSMRSSDAPPRPAEQKLSCQNNVIDGISYCPILKWNGYTYWAFSYYDNRFAMNIVAYDAENTIVGSWPRSGARYINEIIIDEERQFVNFIGAENQVISVKFNDLFIPPMAEFLRVDESGEIIE